MGALRLTILLFVLLSRLSGGWAGGGLVVVSVGLVALGRSTQPSPSVPSVGTVAPRHTD